MAELLPNENRLCMPAVGVILWERANLEMYGNPRASGAEPVSRGEAMVWSNPSADSPKWKYESPAAWRYYQTLDALSSALKDVAP